MPKGKHFLKDQIGGGSWSSAHGQFLSSKLRSPSVFRKQEPNLRQLGPAEIVEHFVGRNYLKMPVVTTPEEEQRFPLFFLLSVVLLCFP